MKILWLSHFLLYPETGYGALQRSRNLLLELSRKHEIIYLGYYRDFDLRQSYTLSVAQKDLEKYCTEVILLPHKHYKKGYKKNLTVLRSLVSSFPYSILLYLSKLMSNRIESIIKSKNIDLVYSDTMGLSEKVLYNIKVPVVLNHHNIESQMMHRRAEKATSLFYKYFLKYEAYKIKKYEKNYCDKYNVNFTVSDLDKERLKEIVPNAKIEVIENGVDDNYFKYHPRNGVKKEIIFTGGMSWYPNRDAMEYFIKEVWPLLKKNIDDIRLTVIGRGPEKIAHLTTNDSQIKVTGFVDDVREYVKNADIFIVPIRDGGGTKLKILDAMSQGIPIVSTRLGFEGINAVDGEHLLMANNPNEFLNKIKYLLDEPDIRNKITENARNLISEKYSYKVIGLKLNRQIESLLN